MSLEGALPDGRPAVFSGAGLSHPGPAGLPLGDLFHVRLRELAWARAGAVVGDLLHPGLLDRLCQSKGNFLARIENTSPGAGAGALACMTVPIPNEGHLLAALHLAHGGLHLTTNFDDGIERAYALLTGTAELPTDAQAAQRHALRDWQAFVPRTARPLLVRSRPATLGRAIDGRPTLIKLHGSLGMHPDGLTLPLGPTSDEVDPGDLGDVRRRAFASLAAAPWVLVTGFSGRDLAARHAILERLERGRFAWVAPEVDGDIRSMISAIDPNQPLAGTAAEALRARIPGSPPPWPAGAPSGVEDRLASWAAGLSPGVAAEAIGWGLCDCGQAEAGMAILRRLVRAGSASASLRLADAVARHGPRSQLPAARRTLLRVATASDRQGRRAYALARWVEVAPGPGGSRPWAGLWLPGVAVVLVAAAVAGAPGPQARVRTATVLVGRILELVEVTLGAQPISAIDARAVGVIARAAAVVAERTLRTTRAAASGRRRALLERQRIELEGVTAWLGFGTLREDVGPALERLLRVFEHVEDLDGAADTAGTQALLALVAGDARACDEALARASRVRPGRGGVVALTATLRSSGQRR